MAKAGRVGSPHLHRKGLSKKGSPFFVCLKRATGVEFLMKERKQAASVFKPYLQKQPMLLPPSLEELVPADPPARVIDEITGGMDLGELYQTYKGGGTSSYDPTMLLKVMILAYSQKIYSSRRIAQAVRENVAFMWLAGATALTSGPSRASGPGGSCT